MQKIQSLPSSCLIENQGPLPKAHCHIGIKNSGPKNMWHYTSIIVLTAVCSTLRKKGEPKWLSQERLSQESQSIWSSIFRQTWLTHLCPRKDYWVDFYNFLHINPSDDQMKKYDFCRISSNSEKFEFFTLCRYIFVPPGINGLRRKTNGFPLLFFSVHGKRSHDW